MTTVPRFGVLTALERWRTVDFISDLHLKPEEPHTFEAWARTMRGTRADAVFILGDLFEAWVGDDAATPGSFEHRCGEVLDACRADLAFMRGNRDFLVGAGFLARHGVLTWGDDLEQAFLRLELVEHLAKIAHAAGEARPLPDAACERP